MESLSESVYTTKSDVWSFGVTMWEMCVPREDSYPESTTTSFWTSCGLDFNSNRLRTVTRNCESSIF
ncbi:hypothetical protein INR49_003210 [Caranx melampygus]|nr:hypothetical protein INR49_003210 [Caranx melampygus]